MYDLTTIQLINQSARSLSQQDKPERRAIDPVEIRKWSAIGKSIADEYGTHMIDELDRQSKGIR